MFWSNSHVSVEWQMHPLIRLAVGRLAEKHGAQMEYIFLVWSTRSVFQQQSYSHHQCQAGFQKFLAHQGQQGVVKQHVFVSGQLHQMYEDNSREILSTFPIVEQAFCDLAQRRVVQQVNLKHLPSNSVISLSSSPVIMFSKLSVKGKWQYIFLLSQMKELLKLYYNLS